jgi:hypothetical protein
VSSDGEGVSSDGRHSQHDAGGRRVFVIGREEEIVEIMIDSGFESRKYDLLYENQSGESPLLLNRVCAQH